MIFILLFMIFIPLNILPINCTVTLFPSALQPGTIYTVLFTRLLLQPRTLLESYRCRYGEKGLCRHDGPYCEVLMWKFSEKHWATVSSLDKGENGEFWNRAS